MSGIYRPHIHRKVTSNIPFKSFQQVLETVSTYLGGDHYLDPPTCFLVTTDAQPPPVVGSSNSLARRVLVYSHRTTALVLPLASTEASTGTGCGLAHWADRLLHTDHWGVRRRPRMDPPCTDPPSL